MTKIYQNEITDRDLHYVEVEPGVTLSILSRGKGRPIVILPGWSQTAAQWDNHITHLSATYQAMAIDMRGHGRSSKPQHGYRVSRLAADLHTVLVAEGLEDVTLIGHSMGCAVIWSYLELFGGTKIRNLVLIDQGAAIVANPSWSEDEKAAAGSVFTADEAIEIIGALRGPDGDIVTTGLLGSMTSDEFPKKDFEWLLGQNLAMPRDLAATLLYDHVFKDWTDVIGRIAVPTLVIGAQGSIVPWQAMATIGEMISDSKTFIFDAKDGGSHFAFLENPTKMLELLDEFLQE